MPREMVKWMLTLDISYPVKYPRRDLANGFLIAETLSSYFPDDITMHSYVNASSGNNKSSNWALLTKQMRKVGVRCSPEEANKIMHAEGDYALDLITQIYHFCTRGGGPPQPPPRVRHATAAARGDAVRCDDSPPLPRPTHPHLPSPPLPHPSPPTATPSCAAGRPQPRPPPLRAARHGACDGRSRQPASRPNDGGHGVPRTALSRSPPPRASRTAGPGTCGPTLPHSCAPRASCGTGIGRGGG